MDIKKVKASIIELGQLASAKITARQHLVEAITAAKNAPATRQDIQADLFTYLDQVADQYPRELANKLRPYFNHPQKRMGQYGPMELLHYQTQPNQLTANPAALFYLLRDVIKTGIARALTEIDEPPGALSRTAREAEIAALEKQLLAIDVELNELNDLAANVGVTIPKRPLSPEEKDAQRQAENRARREQEAAQRPAPLPVLAEDF